MCVLNVTVSYFVVLPDCLALKSVLNFALGLTYFLVMGGYKLHIFFFKFMVLLNLLYLPDLKVLNI